MTETTNGFAPAPGQVVGPPQPIGYFQRPDVPRGHTVVFGDRVGNFTAARGAMFTGRRRWSAYYLINMRLHDLPIDDTTRSQSAALRFQVKIEARWKVADPVEFMRGAIEQPEGYCRARVLNMISAATKDFAPREASAAQARLDGFNETGLQVGNGLFVGIDTVVLLPPEGIGELIETLDGGSTQFDVDRLRRVRENADRLNLLNFDSAQNSVTAADARDRGDEWLRRADEIADRAELPRRAERPALPVGNPFDDDVIDVTPSPKEIRSRTTASDHNRGRGIEPR